MEVVDLVGILILSLTILVPINGLLFLGMRNERKKNRQIKEALMRLRLLTKVGRK
jgi:hypothetical protein